MLASRAIDRVNGESKCDGRRCIIETEENEVPIRSKDEREIVTTTKYILLQLEEELNNGKGVQEVNCENPKNLMFL